MTIFYCRKLILFLFFCCLSFGQSNQEIEPSNQDIKPSHQAIEDRICRLPTTVHLLSHQLIGTPYQWGAVWSGVGSKADCSGLIHGGLKSIGVNVPRTTRQFLQHAQFRIEADHSDTLPHRSSLNRSLLQPLDILIFLSTGSSTGRHAALYLGDGLVLHARRSGTKAEVFSFCDVNDPQSRYWRPRWIGVYRPTLPVTLQVELSQYEGRKP
jgi:hypothetical protein